MHPDDKDFFSWLIVTKENLEKELDTPNENSNDRINYYETGYENGWNESAQEVAAILQDLIAELRDGHRARSELVWAVPLWAVQAIDRAEARLREVTGDE